MKLPYSLRANQSKIIDNIKLALEDRNHLILEAPTGSGKTFTSLAAALPFITKRNMKIVYCVRTNSQQKQVISELQQFNKSGNEIKAVAIQGREALCPQQKNDTELKKSNWSEKSKICKSLKLKSKLGESGCPFYSKLLKEGDSLTKKWSSEILTAQEFSKRAC